MRPFASWAKIIGHRGSAGSAPENTLISLREAFEAGAQAVHFDVMLARDGVPVLFHDDMLDRTTNAKGPTRERTSVELKALDAGSWFLPQCAGEPVPTLDEALRLCASLGLRINIELHPASTDAAALASAVIESLETHWSVSSSLPLISSRNPDCLMVFRDRQPDWPRGMVFHELPRLWRDMVIPLELTTYHGNNRNPNLLLELVATAKPVYAYVVNDLKRARSLSALGIAGIVSDYPGQMSGHGVLSPPRGDMQITSG